MNQLKRLRKNIQRKAIPVLTSVTMVSTMFAGTSLTSFAATYDVTYAVGSGTQVTDSTLAYSTDANGALTTKTPLEFKEIVTAPAGNVLSKYVGSVDGSTTTNDYKPGTEYVFTSATTLTPEFEPADYTMTFDPGSGDNSDDQLSGDELTKTYGTDVTITDP
ncbi:MAG: hypothetical protein K6B41_00400, partial [Butyrivibrio sp.]|nr:hypothetical protein [Butyrivibrio sp.]